ncbi:MAG: reverse transcriptase N-terminal domain-containing protein [Chloracidobacterium sp.]|nr:reverse transcriptase N-terminal domain-containing protein [Chloracidobacterium sp.]
MSRLQRRIVEAQQQGKKRKVRALQFILTRSYSARCMAVRRVVECNYTDKLLSQRASVAVPRPPKRAFERLEPTAVKIARWVLRGGRWQ